MCPEVCRCEHVKNHKGPEVSELNADSLQLNTSLKGVQVKLNTANVKVLKCQCK